MNMLQTKKEELKKQGKKGFTLMELLIVVAIIAVLVAIAIPLFTNQLEKSREAVDEANLRSAYAECSAALLTGEDGTNAKLDAKKTSASATVSLEQQEDGWKSGTVNIGGVELKNVTVGTDVTVTVTASGATFKQGDADLSK